jgi:hypothetical protein
MGASFGAHSVWGQPQSNQRTMLPAARVGVLVGFQTFPSAEYST